MEIIIRKITDEKGKELTGYDRELPFKIAQDNIEKLSRGSNIPRTDTKGNCLFNVVTIPEGQGDWILEKMEEASKKLNVCEIVENRESAFDGSCTCPGSAPSWGYWGGDPGSDPEFDNLPTEDEYKTTLIAAYADELVKNIAERHSWPKEGIYDMMISDSVRQKILDFSFEKVNEFILEEYGKWPDDQEILERFADQEPDFYTEEEARADDYYERHEDEIKEYNHRNDR